MKCPKCGADQFMVVDSRPCKDGIRRRRQCVACEHRFSTYEYPAGLARNILLGCAKTLRQAAQALEDTKI